MQLSCNYLKWTAWGLLWLAWGCGICRAQESPFFVTYTHHMEEPGNLELAFSSTAGMAGHGRRSYFAPYMELEYGFTAQWTSEFYLEADRSSGDSAVFTGWRWENRYKPLRREHWINPVLYLEYASLNEASRITKEVEGNAPAPDLGLPITSLTRSHDHELEGKLILSSDHRDWNISENFILAKNFSRSEGVEFGYALGIYRPLASVASARDCRFCRENFALGGELYGGLGSTLGFGLHDTAHYLAPALAWMISDRATLRFSSAFGLSRESSPVIFRFGYAYEIQGLASGVSRLLGKNR